MTPWRSSSPILWLYRKTARSTEFKWLARVEKQNLSTCFKLFLKNREEEYVSLWTFPFIFSCICLSRCLRPLLNTLCQGSISVKYQPWMGEISSNCCALYSWGDILHPPSSCHCCQCPRNVRQVTATKINYWPHCLSDELRPNITGLVQADSPSAAWEQRQEGNVLI